jgi:hypothetical protein
LRLQTVEVDMQFTDPIMLYCYLTFNFLINNMKELQKIGQQPFYLRI